MVKVNSEKCIGCGSCVSVCDEVFEIDSETHKARVKAGQENSERDCVQQAKDFCPVQAIE